MSRPSSKESLTGIAGSMIRGTVLVLLYVALIEPEFFGLIGAHFLRLAVLVWLLAEVSGVFIRRVVSNVALSATAKNVLTSAYAIFAVLVMAEAVFVFVPYSHGTGYTYAARNWFEYFWHTNDLGYRDRKPDQIDPSKPRILVVGDSFTAGHGIRNPDDAFPTQLGRLIGDDFEVLNLGENGADTRRELRNLLDYPVEPDILILQYFSNDIEAAARESGMRFSGFSPYGDLNGLMRRLIQASYLLNYLYWQFPHGDGAPYLEFLDNAYRNPLAVESHLGDLADFVDYSRACGVPLMVVVFPRLLDIDHTNAIMRPVVEFFDMNDIPVVDVSELVVDMRPRSRIVNSNDGHPSVPVHKRVAEAISAKLTDLGWLGQSSIRSEATQNQSCRFGE